MPTVSKIGRGVLWAAPLVLAPIAFFAALPWLKTLSQPLALTITAAVSVLVMSYANYLGFHAQRRLDEVQKAGAAFAAQWGAPVGQAVFTLLLLLTPFRDFAAAVARRVADNPGLAVDGSVIAVILSLGFCTLVFLQALGTVLVQALWWTAKR